MTINVFWDIKQQTNKDCLGMSFLLLLSVSALFTIYFGSSCLNTIFSSPEPLGSQGELIVYPWPGVRPSSVVCRPSSVVRPSVVNNFKHLLLRNRLANQSHILCGACLDRRNESLFAASGSHDQDGRHAHIW